MDSLAERGAASPAVERYVAAFEALEDRRPAGPPALARARAAAIARFAELGFPTTRDEEYRFTAVAPIAATPFERAADDHGITAADLQAHLYGADAAAELVFVNGRYAQALSSIGESTPGLTASPLADALGAPDVAAALTSLAASDVAFTALNTAFFEDAAVIRIAPGAVVDRPVNVVFVSTAGDDRPAVSYPRILILAGERSQATVVESHVGIGDGQYFSCAVTEALCAPSSIVDHYRVQLERSHGYHYCRLQVKAERQATFLSHAFSLGGAIVRNDVGAVLAGEGIDCTLNGLYIADGDTLVDNHTTIDHAMPHCGSHEVYKGILGGAAKGVFNGKIIVREDAQKTDAKQTNKALLLSGQAQINTKPQLEIFADDVKCTHGATVGQLDADAMFYLRARGIAQADARQMLIRSFAGDIVARVKFDALRDRLDQWLLASIPADAVK
jgi:Fe-S cluster assembly protein SufD